MPYCAKCGSEVSQFAAQCPDCGAPQNNMQNGNNNQYQRNMQPDNGGFLWGLLGFCIPVVGLILFLVWNNERPKTAKAAGIGAIVSVIATVLFYIVYIVFFVAMMSSTGGLY